jgi:hypothetical protein
VAVTQAPSTCCALRDAEHHNLHADPGAIERIECARRHLPLRNLLNYLNANDSLFSTCGCKAWGAEENDAFEPCVFASRVDLIFLREDANFGTGPHENLAKRLSELLEREPGDTLRVELQLAAAEFGGENRGFCTRILLYAKGNTPGQAELRWGLGLARLQQALLFVARAYGTSLAWAVEWRREV